MSQTSTLILSPDGILGMIADVTEDDKISRAAEGAVFLGLLTVFGTNNPAGGTPGQCKEIADAAANVDNFAGIPIWESAKEPYPIVNGKSTLADKKIVSLMRRGRIWTYVEGVVNPSSTVFVRVLTVGADQKGQMKNGAAANFVAFPQAKFITTTTASGLAQIEIR